jgi:hypothetical protein
MKYLPVTRLFSKYDGMAYTEILQREFAKERIILNVL